MSLYTPTKEELEEMGFIDSDTGGNWMFHEGDGFTIIRYSFFHQGFEIFSPPNHIDIFPRSRSDIEKLIELFTPTNK